MNMHSDSLTGWILANVPESRKLELYKLFQVWRESKPIATDRSAVQVFLPLLWAVGISAFDEELTLWHFIILIKLHCLHLINITEKEKQVRN